jgi:predicted nuclease of predicted toxin-antitoxin system
LDHHVPERFAVDLRLRGFDAQIAREVGNERASDETHLRWATEHGRVVLTSDFDDYPNLAEGWFFEGRDHAGIILLEQPRWTSYGTLLRRLLRLLDTLTSEEMVNRVEWLDHRWSDQDESDRPGSG